MANNVRPETLPDPEVEVFKDDGEPGQVKQCIGLVLLNAPIIEHHEGQLVPAIRMNTTQARQLIERLFSLVVEIDSDSVPETPSEGG